MALKDFIHGRAIELGKDAVRMTTASGSGHPSSALSIAHLVATLMYDVMRWDPADPWNAGADRLVLSEGHAVPAVYAAYADLGGVVGRDKSQARVLSKSDLLTLREAKSVLDGHPNPAEGFPFFDAATGSLGQGLSVGAGLGLAARQRSSDKQIYVLIGDGESREGQIWEAMDFIADHKLTNVVTIFNCNGQGQADYVSKQQSPEALAAKATAFGFATAVIDGHDPDAIKAAIGNASGRSKPLAVIAKTKKGWGCPALQDKSNHGKPVTADKLDAAIAELDANYAALGIERGVKRIGAIAKPAVVKAFESKSIAAPSFETAIEMAGLSGAVAKGKCATRRAYGAALVALGQADERVVALDGDVSNSTFAEMFAAKFPQRFFECKIAEQNMISAAAGMAAAGFIPFASSFAKFLARGYDQIEMAQITRANIKLVGSHSGISLAADGPSQMSLQDMAYFNSATRVDDGRGHPACVVLQPSDAVSAYHCTVLLANHVGMGYLRTHRPEVALLYPTNTRFEIGGSHTLMNGDALTIVSSGYMVHVCKDAATKLAAAGRNCTLIDAYSLPLNSDQILKAGAKTGGRILVVEDNYDGGVASSIAVAAATVMPGSEHFRIESMTVRRIPKSAKSPEDILAYVGLGVDDIVAKATSFIR